MLWLTCPMALGDVSDPRELARAQAQNVMPGVFQTQGPDGLTAIHDPACAAAIWVRAPRPQFQSWLDTLPAATLPKTRRVLQAKDVRRAIEALCAAKGMEDSANRAMLVDDISAMADLFAAVMEVQRLSLRLDVINTNACRKFHIDAVTARLVCTLRGTGTQYGTATEGRGVETYRTVGTGSPILLRGTQWPVTPKTGLLHRSPPIEGTGETRLVLVLDPASDFDTDPQPHFMH